MKLTDFNDDFFIGNTEMSNLINDCYTEVYALLANKKDRTFIQEVTLHDGDWLPDHIFKISEITSRNIPLQKSQDYDIENNRLILHNDIHSAVVKFYPEPHRLTLKSNVSEEMAQSDILTAWEDGFIQEGKVIDDSGNTLITFPAGSVALSNGYIQTGGVRLYNGSTAESPAMIRGNSITYDKVLIDTTLDLLAVISNESQSFHYLLDTSMNLYTMDEELIQNISAAKTLYCKEDGLYIVMDGQIQKILGKVAETMHSGVYTAVGILDSNEAVYRLGDRFMRKGYGTDSVLDNPNAVFWSYLSYTIAEAICSLVQRPSENISRRKAELYGTFLNSLDVDDNSVYQIRNVGDYTRW